MHNNTYSIFKKKSTIFFVCLLAILGFSCNREKPNPTSKISKPISSITNIKSTLSPELEKKIAYGKALFDSTPYYLGPNGSVMQLSGNKLSCQNCHLDHGTRLYGNNLLESYLKYPQYRARDGKVLTIEDRINNCFERPLNGNPLPYNSNEMKSMVAYFRWLCEGKVASFNEDSFHLGKIKLLDRAASIENGAILFGKKCERCHGVDGQGRLSKDLGMYIYPPLWGPQSYSMGSSMHRIILTARFIKWCMPYESFYRDPVLTDEQAFDLAAFINCDSIHPRPYRPLEKDCPDLRYKPIDFPSGPYADSFSASQHKYGPYQPIIDFYKKK